MTSPYTNQRTIQSQFEQFHADNPIVYEKFKDFARIAWKQGHRRYGAKAIMERVRWHFSFELQGIHVPDFKINNNYTSWYARLFIEEFPHMEEFFRFRRLRSA